MAERLPSLKAARNEAMHCQRCPLYKRATQTVWGEGSTRPQLMLVGEQPGDIEDKEGQPFVGPAGRLLREALAEAGIDLADVYMTNAVKHFKWSARGKRRIHERPSHAEMMACKLWLDIELARVKPTALVALGATAASSLLGPAVRVTRDRRKRLPFTLAPLVAVTVHPSAILRAGSPDARRAALREFIGDLRWIVKQTTR
jgi:uracil-DNA glycosylase